MCPAFCLPDDDPHARKMLEKKNKEEIEVKEEGVMDVVDNSNVTKSDEAKTTISHRSGSRSRRRRSGSYDDRNKKRHRQRFLSS